MTALTHVAYGRRRRLAQAGLVGRGVLYCLVGILAVQLAFRGGSSQQASQWGALELLAQQPWGTFLVFLLGVFLLGYAAWRFTQFFTAKVPGDSEAKHVVRRASFVVRGVVYLGFAVLAIRTAFGSTGGNGGGQTELTARIMRDVPGGQTLIGLVGLVIIGVGLYQAYQAFTNNFMDELRQGEMSFTERTWTRRVGMAGYSARAIVYSLIGILVLRAAVTFNPQQAQGLGGALQEIAQHTAGPWILGLVALGLFLFGLYAMIRARYVDVWE